MRKHHRTLNWLVVFMFLGAVAACRPKDQSTIKLGKNIIKNPGFESGDEVPSDWERVHYPQRVRPVFHVDTDPQRGRIVGLELTEPAMAGWKQSVTLNPDGRYILSGWIMARNIQGSGAGAAILIPQFRWFRPLRAETQGQWVHVQREVVNAGYTKIDIICTLGAYGGNTGLAVFDDIRLTPVIDPVSDPDQTGTLDIGDFRLRYDRHRGVLVSLKPGTEHSDAPEYLGSYPTLPYLDSSKPCYLGDVTLAVRREDEWKELNTAQDVVKHRIRAGEHRLSVKHDFDVLQPGLSVMSVLEGRPQGDALVWTLEVRNDGDDDVTIGSVDLPFPWNDNYCLFNPHDKASQKLLYTRRVAEHKHIGGHNSYVTVCPMDGSPPVLVVHPEAPDTTFEFTYHSEDTIRDQQRDPGHWIHGAWPGLTRICLVSEGTLEKRGWRPWLNPSTSFVLKSGETRRFQLVFRWTGRRRDLPKILAEDGGIGVRLVPGPALPVNETAAAILYGATPPLKLTGADDWKVENTAEGTPVVTFALHEPGAHTVTITDDRGLTARLFMYALDPIDTLAELRGRFILEHQVYHNPGDPLDGAILCYNNRAKDVYANPKDMWGSGGYEGGITDAQFLALKNLMDPNADEIAFLEKYIHEWLLGGIQDPGDYGVAWMVSRPDVKNRGYNYIHVLNLYAGMARAAAVWPDLFGKTPEHYLDLWNKTFRAFSGRGVRYRDLGLMGRGNITYMPELLRRFGMTDAADYVDAMIQRWGAYWCADPPYPYGSELFFDNTGYESVFFYRDYIGNRALADQAVSVTKAGRGRAPCWFWNDSDQRWWDAVRTAPVFKPFTDFGENCHHYMTGLNGYMLLEAFSRGYQRDDGPIGFAGILNSWARVMPDGFAGMCYCPDPASDNYGLNQFSGDVGLGLWGCLKAAGCYVINDPLLGRTAYGGRIERNDTSGQVVTPWPGLDHRVRFFDPDLFIDAEGPVIVRASRDTGGRTARVRLENRKEHRCRGRIVVSGLPAGTYQYRWQSAPAEEKTIIVNRGARIVIEKTFSPKTSEELVLTAMNERARGDTRKEASDEDAEVSE